MALLPKRLLLEQREGIRHASKTATSLTEGGDLPCINFLTEILRGPALAVFAFRSLAVRSNSDIAAGFKSLRDAKQLASLPTRKFKIPPKRGYFKFTRRGRDLNPRNLAVYRFSRPAVSTTHTPLHLYLLYKNSTAAADLILLIIYKLLLNV